MTSRRRRSCGRSPTSVAGATSIRHCSTRTTARSRRSTSRPLDDSCLEPDPRGDSGPSSPATVTPGRRPASSRRRYGSTSLRVGAARSGCRVIVLLPLAAILWQSAGGGWEAFWSAVTSNAALESFRVTLTISIGVTVVNLFFGLLVAWVLTRDDFPGKRLVDAIIDLPFALPTIVASLVMLALYGPEQPGRHPPAAHQMGRRHRAAVRHAAVRRALGAAGAAGTGPRGGGGRRVAGRQQLRRSSPW